MKVSQAEKAARGHWSRILPALGVNVLKNRHQPCPVCAGKDRFRFDDQEGRGTWFCNQCGAGDGLGMVLSLPVREMPWRFSSPPSSL
ncbi:zinc-binding domain of primase-helicase family protein, partial [Escherichia coli 97.0007]